MKQFLIAVFLLLSFRSSACSCDGTRSFCQAIAASNTRPMFCIALVELISFHHWGAYAKVLDNIYNTANADTIIIWGDNGALCRPGIDNHFNLGDTLIMALEQTDLAGNFMNLSLPDYEDTSDYVLQGCGIYYMYYFNGTVSGEFNNVSVYDFMSYNNFLAAVNNCINSTSVKTVPVSKVELYPNPATSHVRLSATETIQRVELINSLGQCILSDRPGTKTLDWDLSSVPSGVYTIRLLSGNNGGSYHHRFVKQ